MIKSEIINKITEFLIRENSVGKGYVVLKCPVTEHLAKRLLNLLEQNGMLPPDRAIDPYELDCTWEDDHEEK